MNEQLIKRIKSWAWREGSLIAVSLAGLLIEIVPQLGWTEFATVTIVLVLGEITKYFNNGLQHNN